MSKFSRNVGSFDWVLIVLYLALISIGWVNIYSASYDPTVESFFSLENLYSKQLLWILLGFLIISFILFLESKFFERFSSVIYIASLLSLLLLFVFGKTISGATSWYNLGFMSLQPSEFAKAATALALAKYLSDIQTNIKTVRDQVRALAIIALPALIIIPQPDPGSALVYAAFIFPLYREGLAASYLILGASSITLFVLTLLIGPLYVALAVLLIAAFLFYKNRKRFPKDTKRWFVDVVAVLSIFYFAFHVFWGLNYYRLPLHKNLNLNRDYTTEQLVFVTKKMIEKSNAYHLKITNNDTLKINIPFSKSEIFKRTQNGYDNLKTVFPQLEYHPKSIKKSLFSYPLTYMGFSGYLNPLTNEAQVDALIPVYKFPTTSAHEIAHQLGYAAENEANFIGCLATINNDDLYFKYTGYTFGLRYCLNEIYRRDEALYETIVQTLNVGVLKNYEEVRLFWEVHQNPAEPLFKVFYSNFLKANSQEKGMKSYNYVVALLVNYFESNTM